MQLNRRGLAFGASSMTALGVSEAAKAANYFLIRIGSMMCRMRRRSAWRSAYTRDFTSNTIVWRPSAS